MDDASAAERAADLGGTVTALGDACEDLAENTRDLRTAVDGLRESTDRLRARQRSVARATERLADACETDQVRRDTQVFVPPASDAAPDSGRVDDVPPIGTAGFSGDTQVYVHGD